MFNLSEEPTPCIMANLLWNFIGKSVVIYGNISSIKENIIYFNINASKFILNNKLRCRRITDNS